MSKQRVVTDSMIGLKMPDSQRITRRVATVLGQNPSPFTGPGTNTWIVGTSKRPILLDTGQGVPVYADLLENALKELVGAAELERIVLTHAHIDHLGGVRQVTERFGEMEVLKMPWEGHDAPAGEISAIGHDAVVHTEGATLRAVHTPGHAPDHLCYYLEEERALFTGDVVLGAGTTVIPDDTGDLSEYMDSLRRLLELDLETIYPAHGPVIRNPREKIGEYIAHRELRERQVIEALKGSAPLDAMAIVKKIYVDVPEYLHPAAASSVRSHLRKLEREGRVTEHEKRWSLN
jgi:glyoxylase-like metal-dependent hydrolase (beta-lactamase superfamily II)